jgi:hypothetical protein
MGAQPVIHEAQRVSTAEKKRRREQLAAELERRVGFPLTAAEIARAARLRAGERYSVAALAAAIRTTRAARGKL